MTSPTLAESYEFCRKVARREAGNFYPSFLLLPKDRRRNMCALYAFLRHSDDIADNPAPLETKRANLDAWRSTLQTRLDGSTTATEAWPGWPALVDTVRTRAIPPRYLFDVLDGVAMDLVPQPFATFEALHDYCYKVASAVGLSCLHIWGFRSEEGKAEALAEATGLALQLTNIIRDVREDALNGRVYLPKTDLDRFGVTPETLIGPNLTEPVRALLAFEADRAYRYYEEAKGLEALVDPVGRPVLNALVGVYRRLLDEIADRRFDVFTTRVTVARWRKLAILAVAFARGVRGKTHLPTMEADNVRRTNLS